MVLNTNTTAAAPDDKTAAPAAGQTPAAVAELDVMKPRPYQDQLLEIAMQRNTIVYLPTGAGKTYIALMTMKRLAGDLTRSLADGGKRSIFIVNTVVLANQQMEAIRRATALRVAKYTGDMNVDAWRRDRWLDEFEENQVLVATCQIILDVLRHGFIRMEHINLIVMDECHHGRNEHPMHQLMRLYCDASATARPRIIGLTGMLIAASVKPDNVIEELNALETVFQARIATVRTYQEMNNVLVFSTKPNESLVRYAEGSNADAEIVQPIRAYVERLLACIEAWPVDQTHQRGVRLMGQLEPVSPKKVLQTYFKDFLYQLDDLGLYGASIAILSVIVEMGLKKRGADTRQMRSLFRLLITGAERIRHWILREMYDDDEDEAADDMGTILSNSSPKMVQFLLYMRKYYASFAARKQMDAKTGEPVPLKALVFVHRRRSAKCVFIVLQRFAKSIGEQRFDVRADFMVGNNSGLPESLEAMIENKANRRVVDRFRSNEVNLIVASSVLEEGIDLQECNLVVSLDRPQTFRSYVQSKGRARMQSSDYVMFVPTSAESKTLIALSEWRTNEQLLKTYLIEKAVDRTAPLEEDVVREFGLGTRREYRTAKGALLEEMSAVQLLQRYCVTLPFDTLAPPRVDWDKAVVTEGGAGAAGRPIGAPPGGPIKLKVSLRLPMQSTVRHRIEGRVCGSLAAAKRSAAFEACVQLHQAGELSDNLMPINARRCLAAVSADYFRHWRQHENEKQRNAGTRKCARIHPIVWPKALQNCDPARAPKSQCFLYIIHMEPAFESASPDPTIAGMHRLLADTASRRFGILIAHRLPAIGCAKLFQNFGAISVRLSREPVRLPWNEAMQRLPLRQAHEALFGQLLRTTHPFLYANDGSETAAVNDFLIVPCTSRNAIDVAAVHALLEHRAALAAAPSALQRQSHRYDPQHYVNAVVAPWYRSEPDARYIVTRVCTDRTPFGVAPAGELPAGVRSYAEYIRNHWQGVQPVNRECRFMLEVRGITQKLNRLVPGLLHDGGKKAAQRERVEYLIPELCHRLDVPADLWLQAVMLPSFLHRLQHALNAEELRTEINAALGIRLEPAEPDALPEPWLCAPSLPVAAAAAAGVVQPKPKVSKPAAQNAVQQALSDPWSLDELDDKFAHLDIVLPGKAGQQKPVPSAVDSLACPWSDIEEPADLGRIAIDNVYELDLQYYSSFIEEHEPNIDLTAIHQSPSTIDQTPIDRPAAVRPIRLLDITAETPTTGPRQCDLLAAITVNRSNDVFNGERLEVLGDAFLKFAASAFLLSQHPTWHEGHLSSCKGQLVSNRNLFYLGAQRGLAGRLKVYRFDPQSTWTPPAMHVHRDIVRLLADTATPVARLADYPARPDARSAPAEREQFERQLAAFRHNITEAARTYDADAAARIAIDQPMQAYLGEQGVADKIVADAVEACLGATLLAVGVQRTFHALRFWGILPEPGSLTVPMGRSYERLLHATFVRARLHDDRHVGVQRDIDDLLPNYALLERQLGYAFRDRAYLLQALTHPSFVSNGLTACYQQLEFLGDAVLDVLITAHIYERCPDMQPGQMTDLRSALVNNVTLGCLAVRFGIERFVLAQNSVLAEQTAAFVQFQRARQHRVTEMVLLLSLGDDDDGEEEEAAAEEQRANGAPEAAPRAPGAGQSVRMGEHVNVPKMLGDVLEALIGAIFLDCGNDLRRTWEIVYGLMHAEIESFVADTPLQAVRRLGEFVSAAARYDAPFVQDGTAMVRVLYTCRNEAKEALGFGHNGAAAKMAAAETALKDLLAC